MSLESAPLGATHALAAVILDNRKFSIVFWATVALALCLTKREIRSSMFAVIKAACVPRIAIPLAGLLLYVATVVTALRSVGIWTPNLLADTAFWLIGTGLVLFFVVYDRARTDPHFFRRTALRTLAGAVILEFFVDLKPLPLPAELILVPFLVLLGALLAVSAARAELAPVSTVLNGVLAFVGLGLMLRTVTSVTGAPAGFATIDTARAFAIPVLLTITFLPFVYGIAVYGNLDGLRAELRWILNGDTALYRYARRRVLLTVGLRLRAVLRAANSPWHLMLARPSSRTEIDRVIEHIKRRRSNALATSVTTEAHLDRIATEQPPGWEYLLFAARLESGEAALVQGQSAPDNTGRAFDKLRSRRKAIDRLQRDNQEAIAIVGDIESVLGADEVLNAFGAPGEPGDAERIVLLAEKLILKRDHFQRWTRRARATSTPDDLTMLFAAHAELLDLPNQQLEEYIERWIDFGEQLPRLLEDAEQASEPLKIEMALIITVDDQVLERFTDEIARLDDAA